MQARARAVVIVLIGVLASGCAAGGYNAETLRDRLVDAGLRPSQATCVIDAMVHRFGERQLNAHKDPNATEIQEERRLLRKCGVDGGAVKPRR